MGAQSKIKIQYAPVQTWPGLTQQNFVGAQSVAGRRGTLPTFTDVNTKYVDSVNGSDASAIAANTLALWKMENDFGVDYSGNNYNLSTVGTVPYPAIASVVSPPAGSVPPGRYATGPYSAANYFVTASTLNTALNGLTVYSIEFYIMVTSGVAATEQVWKILQTSTTATQMIASSSNAGANFILTWSVLAGASPISTANLNFNTWYKVSCVNDGAAVNKRVIYINQASSVTSVTAAPMPAAIGLGNIGSDNAATPLAHGYVKNFRISTVARTSAFTADTNTNTGATASPFQSIGFALSQIDNTNMATFANVVVKDSASYNEQIDIWQTNVGLYAADGQAPTIKLTQGAIAGTYGARLTGRTRTYIQAGGVGTNYYVAKTGNDANSGLSSGAPKLTISNAITTAASGDCINIIDSGIYVEDLNAGAKILTIQSSIGQVPTLTNVNLSGNHVTGTNSLYLYGLNLKDANASTGNIVSTTKYLECYDCNFINNASGINMSGGGDFSSVIKNCFFFNQTALGLIASYNTTVFNCYFTSKVINSVGLDLAVNNVAGNCLVKNCSFVAYRGLGSALVVGQNASSIVASTDTILSCSFISCGVAIGANLQPNTSRLLKIDNCYFYKTTNQSVNIQQITNNVVVQVTNCLSYYGMSVTPASNQPADFNMAGGIGSKLENCVSIGCGVATTAVSFYVAVANVAVNNCVSYKCAGTAFNISVPTGCSMTGCIESQSNVGITAASAFSPTYSDIQTSYAGSATAGTGCIASDPKFLNTVLGQENLGLSPLSPCISSGNSGSDINMGLNGKLVRFSGPGGTLNGFNLDGAINFHNAVTIENGFATTISYCSLKNLGPVGVISKGGSQVDHCSVQVNGIGIQIGESSGTIQYNIGISCVSTFVMMSAPGTTVKNNSSFNCLYGQYDDQVGSANTVANNIYFASGSYDYSGNNTQTFSCIGTLDPSTAAAVDANSTRLNPIFRNPLGGDLRPQVIAASTPLSTPPINYYFDSPCKLLGSDGKDMGAFQFSYGAISETWTTVDFSTTGYRNPDGVLRTIEAVKLAEFVREDNSTESTATGYPLRFKFNWGPSNDMPAAQVTDLTNIYSNASPRVRIDMGAGYQEYAVLKSTTFEYEELGGIPYSNDQVPTPVKNMEFRHR